MRDKKQYNGRNADNSLKDRLVRQFPRFVICASSSTFGPITLSLINNHRPFVHFILAEPSTGSRYQRLIL